MNNLNSILIEGNLVREPLFRTTPKGTSVCTFSVASNRFYRNEGTFEKEVGFFEVETWAKLAEACYNNGKKGRGVRIVGCLKQDRWHDADGKLRSKITIVAEHVEFRPDYAGAAQTGYTDEELSSIGEGDYSGKEEISVEETAEEFALATA